MDLHEARVVVTGGSTGIGAGLARAFAAQGATVVVVARSEDKLRAVADEIGGSYLVADLTVAADVDALFGRCIERLGHVDVWVNNAGVETSSSFAAAARADVRELARLNFEAAMLLTHDAVGHFLDRRAGHLVQMSSVAGAVPFPGLAAYSGSKAGLTNFSETLRIELRRTGVGLTVVSPGPVATEMWERLDDVGRPFVASALTRFRHLGFLPTLDVDDVVAATIRAVQRNRRVVRLPRRYGVYHVLNNAPRRLVGLALAGVRFPDDRVRSR